MVKKGDTLIEVVLAVGIFSMVAIAVVAVMNGGTSGAQTSLETTLARAEIDSQAEALRFIHTSYIAEKDSASQKYQTLWKQITEAAVPSSVSGDAKAAILQYSPTSCPELYSDGGEVKKYAFIINYSQLSDTADDVFIWAKNNPERFATASTYPRLVYSGEENSSLIDGVGSFSSAEGIYIIAVKDNNTTNINNKKTSAFYDFYIRTCWYGSNADEPSTISTIIRLYDPAAIK